MANYNIEGTISELSIKDGNCNFKICGIEGYSVKHGKEKYNLLYSEYIKENKDKNPISTFVLIADRIYQANEKQECLLASALIAGKRIRVEIEATEDEIKSGMKELSVSSLTLLLD